MTKLQSTIDGNDKIAKALGRFIAHWALLESELSALFGGLLRTDQFRQEMVFNTFPALGQKIVLVKRLLFAFVDDGEPRDKALDFCSRITALNDARTKYVHSEWGYYDDKKAIIFPQVLVGTSHKDRFATGQEVTAESIQNDCDKVAELSGEMMHFRMAAGPQALVVRQRPLA